MGYTLEFPRLTWQGVYQSIATDVQVVSAGAKCLEQGQNSHCAGRDRVMLQDLTFPFSLFPFYDSLPGDQTSRHLTMPSLAITQRRATRFSRRGELPSRHMAYL